MVNRDTANHVMGTGPYRNAIAGYIEAKLSTDFRHPGKSLPNHRRIEVRQVEVYIRMLCVTHHFGDGPGNDITRRQFRSIVEGWHESPPFAIDETGAGTANGLGDQTAGAASDIEHRGMKLHELHVANLGASPPSEGHPVTAGSRRVR